MTPVVEARIVDLDRDVYYPTRLQHIPRQGDLLKMFSHLDAASGHEMHTKMGYEYQVIQVLHEVTDFKEDVERPHTGRQHVTIYVRRSHDPLLR